MTTKADIAISKLIDEGWTISHTALYPSYLTAGTVSPMQTRKGIEYCRVHHGKSLPAKGYSYQLTTVMAKKRWPTNDHSIPCHSLCGTVGT